jgi:hypothetical protein
MSSLYYVGNLPDGLKREHLWAINELLQDYLTLLPRWKEVKRIPYAKQKFCSRNRNPLFDISSFKFFKTELGTKIGLVLTKPVYDHYIQRTKAVEFIFNKLESEPEIDLLDFVYYLKKICSVVALTEEEHKTVTSFCKKNKKFYNFQAYKHCGIKIEGRTEFIDTEWNPSYKNLFVRP